MPIERADISQVLAQMRTVRAHIERATGDVAMGGRIAPTALAQPQPTANFGDLLGRAIDSVNDTQKAADSLRQSYELGAPGVSLTQVMVASEKSSVAFQGMVQVRNKLVDAYQEIMNMPV